MNIKQIKPITAIEFNKVNGKIFALTDDYFVDIYQVVDKTPNFIQCKKLNTKSVDIPESDDYMIVIDWDSPVKCKVIKFFLYTTNDKYIIRNKKGGSLLQEVAPNFMFVRKCKPHY